MIRIAEPLKGYLSCKDEIDAAISRVLTSGRYILGREVDTFESEFASFLNVENAIGVGNGTDAIHLALRALGVGSSDEVILPSHTAVATAAAVTQCGATPVFVDISRDSFCLDPLRLEHCITTRTKAIIAVHLYGRSCEMNQICEIGLRHGIPILEDCAQAHGASYLGKTVGSLGVIGCFSFYPTKNLGALGDGGAIVTSNTELARQIRRMREYGWEQRYVSEVPGWNSRLDELQAAILRVKLGKLEVHNLARRKLANRYLELLKDCPIALPTVDNHTTHVFHLFVIRTNARNALQEYLRRRGIETTIQYPIPIHKQAAYRVYANDCHLPETDIVAEEILSLPIYPELTHWEQDVVIEAIKEFYGTQNLS